MKLQRWTISCACTARSPAPVASERERLGPELETRNSSPPGETSVGGIGIRMSALGALAVALLWGCGGNGGSQGAPRARGSVVSTRSLGQVTTADIDAAMVAYERSLRLHSLAGAAACPVDVRYMVYTTRDPRGEPATASTAILVPSGAGATCSGERPVVLYAHGTALAKSFDMARVSIADPAANLEAQLAMAMFAAQGFIVVAPNYLGYDASSLDYHPYLDAEAQAVDVVDALRAARAHLAAVGGTTASKELFITGYSEGGHVAMAAHEIIERDYAIEMTVSASAPMSGAYNLVGNVDEIVAGQVSRNATFYAVLLITGSQRAYGTIYASPSDVYQSPYDTTAETLFPTDTPLSILVAQGKLPDDPSFSLLFGPGGLLKDSMRDDYPHSEWRKALQANTLLGWNPKAPMVLCGGGQDPEVFYVLNTTAAASDFASRGVAVTAWNLEDRATLPGGATGDAIYDGFQAQKAAFGADAAVVYHGALVWPFCEALVRDFFQQVLASGR
jgi:hypothetical protein